MWGMSALSTWTGAKLPYQSKIPGVTDSDCLSAHWRWCWLLLVQVGPASCQQNQLWDSANWMLKYVINENSVFCFQSSLTIFDLYFANKIAFIILIWCLTMNQVFFSILAYITVWFMLINPQDIILIWGHYGCCLSEGRVYFASPILFRIIFFVFLELHDGL